MSLKGDIARLLKIRKYISDIDTIIRRHTTAEKALTDMESQYALMLCFAQIGEILNKITTPEFVDSLPVKDAVAFRNIIIHDYEHMSAKIAVKTLNESIPDLKRRIEILLKKHSPVE